MSKIIAFTIPGLDGVMQAPGRPDEDPSIVLFAERDRPGELRGSSPG